MSRDSYYIRPDGVRTRTGAGGVVARLDDGGRVLIALIRKPGNAGWVLPKGGVEKDESLEQAARREIEEEAGFTRLHSLGELGIGERLNGRRTTWQTTHYLLFLTDEKNPRPGEFEHRDWEVEWFALDDLPIMHWREQRQLIEENREEIERRVRAGGAGPVG